MSARVEKRSVSLPEGAGVPLHNIRTRGKAPNNCCILFCSIACSSRVGPYWTYFVCFRRECIFSKLWMAETVAKCSIGAWRIDQDNRSVSGGNLLTAISS